MKVCAVLFLLYPLIAFCSEGDDVNRGMGNLSVEQCQWIAQRLEASITDLKIDAGVKCVMGRFTT